MNGFPWLTVAGAVPLAGALVVALIPGLPQDSAEADRRARDAMAKWLAPVVGTPPVAHGLLTVTSLVALLLALVGVGLAWMVYGRVPVPETAPHGSPLTVAARNELYGNTINESLVMRPGQWLTRLSVYFDNRGVDGLVNSLAALVGGTSGRWRRIQTGFVRSYALSMFFGAVIVVALLLAVRL